MAISPFNRMNCVPVRLLMMSCLGCCVVWFSGCTLPNPFAGGAAPTEFIESEGVKKLIPEAREAVSASVENQFGTASGLRTPTYLPIELGGMSVVVEGYQGDGSDQKEAQKKTDRLVIRVKNEEDKTRIESGQVFVRMLETPVEPEEPEEDDEEKEIPYVIPVVRTLPRIVSYDAESGTVELDQSISTEDLKGAIFLVNAGEQLVFGQQVYKTQCMQCHGFSGDGKGPTSKYMNPQPRDFRHGKFKFTSTGATEKASTEDLHRLIVEGVPGTYMPSFKVLQKEKREAVVAYLKYLSMRGEFEKSLTTKLKYDYSEKAVAKSLKSEKDDKAREELKREIINEFRTYRQYDYLLDQMDNFETLRDDWKRADKESSIIRPSVRRPKPHDRSLADSKKTSLENGRFLFLSKKAQCVSCHGKAGRGDGVQTRAMHKPPGGKSFYPVPGLHDEWGNATKPRDLSRGVLRGGSRPIDVYRRIYAGIKGTQMIPFGGTGLTDEEIWDLVNYVLELPSLKNGELP